MRRYEHPYPGSLIHVDVKKLGNIPDGGGWRFVGRQQGKWNHQATPGKSKSKHYNEQMRHAFVHTVIDDHTRIAYAEVHDDETAATATAVLARAVAWYAARGITVERVLSDNGSAYRSSTTSASHRHAAWIRTVETSHSSPTGASEIPAEPMAAETPRASPRRCVTARVTAVVTASPSAP